MAEFFVRVEMRGADRAEYEELHRRMQAAGFACQICAESGPTLQLPPAEYHAILDTTNVEAVRDQALIIAREVRPYPPPWALAVLASAWSVWSVEA